MEPLTIPPGGNEDRASAILAVFWAPYPFTFIVICARLFVRQRIKNLGLDDYAMFLSWILYTISISLASYCMVHGGARHLFYLTPPEISTALKYNYLSQPFGALSPVFGKSSVAFLMLRIMGPHTYWPYGTFMDFALALLPITIIKELNMGLQQKIGLCILLSLGLLAGIASIVKTVELQTIRAEADFTWATYELFIWASIESWLVIICGSIPAVKPLFDRFVKGTPLKPFRADYRNTYGYEVQSSTKISSKPSSTSRYGNSTNVSGNSDPESPHVLRRDSSINMRDIRVEHRVEVEL
nr:putative integral membrane protein [Cladonia uncialis subsp. uncialis]